MKEPNEIANAGHRSEKDLPFDDEASKLAKLYMSTCEMLAGHGYNTIAMQQQWNIVAQALTAENAKKLYAAAIT